MLDRTIIMLYEQQWRELLYPGEGQVDVGDTHGSAQWNLTCVQPLSAHCLASSSRPPILASTHRPTTLLTSCHRRCLSVRNLLSNASWSVGLGPSYRYDGDTPSHHARHEEWSYDTTVSFNQLIN